MEEELGSASVREQLITAGIEELNAHGMAGFSLRRVAAACNISCAAPYKHFKNKKAAKNESVVTDYDGLA